MARRIAHAYALALSLPAQRHEPRDQRPNRPLDRVEAYALLAAQVPVTTQTFPDSLPDIT
jgi:hypothetical protein